jgi:dTDP-4-amino-4,6-dideoxygalactose transaminase
VLSFHATKSFHTFEGGAVATNDDGLAAAVRDLRNHGIKGLDTTSGLGTNAKMPEVCAAMGLANLEAFDTTVVRSRQTFDEYQNGLRGVAGLELRAPVDGAESNWHYVVAEVDEAELGLSRDGLVDALRSENVLARRYFHPGCHALEPYASQAPTAGWTLPVTARATARTIVFPGGSTITSDDVARVCELVRQTVAQARPSAPEAADRHGNG